MSYVALYLAVAIPFVAVDAVWLKLMGQRFYLATIGDIARSEPNFWPALVFYLLYPLGLIALAVLPAHAAASSGRAAWLGLLFGFFTYATYDLTNQAVLRNWTTTLSIVDIAWGGLLGAGSAYCGYLAARQFLV
ncbi:DUF2177 family protein [Bradyrhizobium arachidis]|uniref:DUF2177 domain-containing protein n=1 Tax=Bradyrhizobium guangzhouense TaxID=1325095 RepID=A0AAE5WWH3_9BRAD|nr:MULTISPECIES: DUF2177 family protein [Bradyrhizobium]MDN4984140.1 DUF2177 family protein [Bradyrhizobium sp. WYCCWR 13022]QAU44414.1 DUF2177 domain-containing protein [Bradyrhizobium guangzhouense]QOZ51698.1 DUF2177 domain-containing protein [Bradyrhizobium sp. CCBAU 53338]RXH09282.1 DUF2177 family protein [Bradyrhizobium guangzhouense]RXH10016.1 DUF2177 family protein [Bradyrhizobium guangzhouense]